MLPLRPESVPGQTFLPPPSTNGREEKNYYSKTCFAVGSRRRVFDEFLVNEAISNGAEILYNQKSLMEDIM